MDNKTLRQYLEDVRLLESDIYTMDQAINSLRSSIKPEPTRVNISEPSHPNIYTPHRPTKPLRKEVPFSFVHLLGIPMAILWFIEIEMNLGAALIGYIIGVILALPIRKIINSRSNVIDYERYESDVKFNEKKCAEYEAELVKYHQEKQIAETQYQQEYKSVSAFNDGINRQIASIESSKQKTADALQKLYNLGIIYRKYRSLIPISQFCEYMDSKRRTLLEGKNEMYDLYESELQAKLILDELGTVNQNLQSINTTLHNISHQLTGIQRNQVLLYEEVARGNEIARQIRTDTEAILEKSITANKHLSSIETTSALTAYNTAATARRTDAIAKIAEYEFSLSHPTFPSV